MSTFNQESLTYKFFRFVSWPLIVVFKLWSLFYFLPNSNIKPIANAEFTKTIAYTNAVNNSAFSFVLIEIHLTLIFQYIATFC